MDLMDLRKPYLTFCDQVAKRVRANPAEADGTAMVELRRFCAGRDPQSLKSTILDWKLPPKNGHVFSKAAMCLRVHLSGTYAPFNVCPTP